MSAADAVTVTAVADATLAQRMAADPSLSTWVSASAGSGKTKVLRDRVLRLLLEGARPERILCLTFTKAGAAEMSNRVATTLAEWASMREPDLRADLDQLLGGGDVDAVVSRARGLFARVLDAPGGMRIETIHAFCQSLLRRFPLEAGIAPHFRLIEERDAEALMAEAMEGMLEAAAVTGNEALAAALRHIADHAGETTGNTILAELLGRRADMIALRGRMGGIPAYRRALARLLAIGPDTTREDLLAGAVADAAFDAATLQSVVSALLKGGKSDVERGRAIAGWLAATAPERAGMFDTYARVFLTEKKELRNEKNLATTKVVDLLPGVREAMKREGERLRALGRQFNAVEILADSTALLTLAFDLLDRFVALKRERAALDFDDLILRARELLTRPGITPWVLYKLDGGIDHVLVDEGQDTSPAQWDILKALTEELVAGKGAVPQAGPGQAEERPRSIFAVGDFKQSIFSFQGAEPKAFLEARDHFSARLARVAGGVDPRTPFRTVDLDVSFRSSAAILSVVDGVFAGPARKGVAEGPGAEIHHRAARAGAAGLVEVWPCAVPPDRTPPPEWAMPEIDSGAGDPVGRLADAVAEKIHGFIRSGEILPARGRAITAGDIMVLVRSRNAFVPALVKALKARSVDVAGMDRLLLLSELAVLDLLAFLDFLLLPEDDLNLAALLKSPLLGLGEEELFDLCVGRGKGSLWAELCRAADGSARLAACRGMLLSYLDRARSVTPYELLAELLSVGHGRQRLLARLGVQAGDAIDELLSLALAFERNNPPSLQVFRHWLALSEAEVKRELSDEGGGQVRIMTVHGAKGLQAPIVFLAEQRRSRPNHSGLFWLGADAGLPAWVARSALNVDVTAARRGELDALAQEEENRLLYVALTRAEDRLYACGWRGEKNPSVASWLDHVADAVTAKLQAGAAGLRQPAADWRPEAGWDGDWLQVGTAQEGDPANPPAKAGLRVDMDVPLADWIETPATPEPDPPRPLIPSRPGSDAFGSGAEPPPLSPLGNDQGRRFQRGVLIHTLFQMLPGLAAGERRAAARAWLRSAGGARILGLQDAAIDGIVEEVMAVLEDGGFAHLFGPGSRAEVPIVAELARPDGRSMVVSGQIDRLLVTGDHCHIVDFKSNRPPAMQPEHVSPQYLRQLALYRAAVQRIYPNHAISCYLLWSAGPRLMAIPESLLESHAS